MEPNKNLDDLIINLKPKVIKIVRTFINFQKKYAKSLIHSKQFDFGQQKVSEIVRTFEKVILKVNKN